MKSSILNLKWSKLLIHPFTQTLHINTQYMQSLILYNYIQMSTSGAMWRLCVSLKNTLTRGEQTTYLAVGRHFSTLMFGARREFRCSQQNNVFCWFLSCPFYLIIYSKLSAFLRRVAHMNGYLATLLCQQGQTSERNSLRHNPYKRLFLHFTFVQMLLFPPSTITVSEADYFYQPKKR